MTRRRPTLALSLLAALSMVAAGCERYRIEYHRRPDWHARMVDGPLPDRTVLPDGTIILYNQSDSKKAFAPVNDAPGFELRRTNDDGSVSLFALLPEHVILNTLNCVRGGEYQLLWDELVSERTKMRYEEEGLSYAAFETFFRENRIELGRTLARMSIGISMQDAAVTTLQPGHYRVQFWPHIINASKQKGGGFAFNYVEIVREGFALKLHTIY